MDPLEADELAIEWDCKRKDYIKELNPKILKLGIDRNTNCKDFIPFDPDLLKELQLVGKHFLLP
jgi:hypothetical protein